MLLSELEPGTLFKLTKESIASELAARGPRNPAMIPGTETYVLLSPEVGTEAAFVMPSDENKPTKFYPRKGAKYSVEPLGEMGIMKLLPTRQVLMTSCDPEVFFEDEKGNIVPGFAKLPPKSEPFRVDAADASGVFHEDGFQGEFSPAPRQCHEQVVFNMGGVMHQMVAHVNGLNNGHYFSNYYPNQRMNVWDSPIKISDKSFVELTPELLATGTDKQVALGCDPSENIYKHSWFTHDEPRKFPYRMAGGHIHIGVPVMAPWLHARAERIIKAMDLFCGVPSVALFDGIEDPRRRQFYGRAGEFRAQKHGLEYRVLSNAWLQNQALTHLTLNLARAAFRIGMMNWEQFFKFDQEMVRHIINDHDVPAAKQFIEDHADVLIWALNADTGYGWGAEAVSTLHQGALEAFGESRLSIHNAWVNGRTAPTDPRFAHFVQNSKVKAWGGVKAEAKTNNYTAETRHRLARTRAEVPPMRAEVPEWVVPADLSTGRTATASGSIGYSYFTEVVDLVRERDLDPQPAFVLEEVG